MRRLPTICLRFWACVLLATLASRLCSQDIVGTAWRLGSDGRLEFRMLGEATSGDGTGSWRPLIPDLRGVVGSEMSADAQFLAGNGPMAVLPLFLHGPGGAVCIAEAERRLTKLGIGHTILATQGAWPDSETDELLRIALLSRSGVLVSQQAKRFFTKSPSRFIRAAAAALGDGQPERPVRPRSEQARLGAVTSIPIGYVHVVGVDAAGWADIDGLLAAWRQYCRRRASEADMSAGGSVPLDQFLTLQQYSDIPSQLPLEVAAVLGNWRCDYVAFAAYGSGAWWLHVAGDFSPELARRGLRALGAELEEGLVDKARGVLRGLRVTVTGTSIEIEAGDVPVEHRVGHDPELLRLSKDVDAWMRAGQGLAHLQPLGLTGCEVQLRAGVLTGAVTAPRAAEVAAAWQRWRGEVPSEPSHELGGLTLADLAAIPAGCREVDRDRLTWCRLVHALELEAKDGHASLRLDLRQLSELDFVRLLARWPSAIWGMLEDLPRGR